MTTAERAPAFQQLQRDFAAHIRDPEQHAVPAGVDPRRMRIYRELVAGTNAGLVENAFPVLRRIIGDDAWQALVQAFVAEHHAASPLSHEVASEFVDFLSSSPQAAHDLPAFVPELAHYEWVELALAVDPSEPDTTHADPNGDLLQGTPVLSPLAWPLAYAWPVHKLSSEFQPSAPPEAPTWLLAHRDRQDRVRFGVLNAFSARLLALMAEGPATGEQLLARVAEEAGVADTSALVAQGAQQLRTWREADILLGTQRNSDFAPDTALE